MMENTQIRRLRAEDYDELLALLNLVFTRKNGREMDFEKELPKMWGRDDAHMGRHIGIYVDGKLAAALGVYPYVATIAGEKILFSTVGNVATHPDYEGRGYMQVLFERAMQELEELDVDASRLGGLRQRYNRFGYENAGTNYFFYITPENTKRMMDVAEGITFEPVCKENKEQMEFAIGVYSKSAIAVDRHKPSDMYDSMTAWKNVPHMAMRDGKPIGYLCTDAGGAGIAEHYAVSAQERIAMLLAWQKKINRPMTFQLFSFEIEELRFFVAAAAEVRMGPPCHFKIVHWEKVLGALLRLKASYTTLPEGELTMEIEGYGKIRLYVAKDGVGCESYTGECQVKMDRILATRFLLGAAPASLWYPDNTFAAAVLPLPLSWNLQDRL